MAPLLNSGDNTGLASLLKYVFQHIYATNTSFVCEYDCII